MKLSELAAKPQLKDIIIDDEKIVEEYGDTLQFFIQDRLPIETYTRLASIKTINVRRLSRNKRMQKKGTRIKFGITVPNSVKEALELDRKNKNSSVRTGDML